jgi:hypothetical protein
MIDFGKANPASGCGHIVRVETEEEVLRNAKAPREEHGFSEETPEVAMIKANILDEPSAAGGHKRTVKDASRPEAPLSES